MKRPKRKAPPATPEAWFAEIRHAYADAAEAIPFGPFVGRVFGEEELFQLAPLVAVKFRGLSLRGPAFKRAAETATTSYLANLETEGLALSDPRLAFGFCYLASHFGIGLVEAEMVESVMELLEDNLKWLDDLMSDED